jgi:hypothetical protein
MLDMDIPLNAGCLVPLTGMLLLSQLSSRHFLTMVYLFSEDPEEVTPIPIADRSGLWWQCPDFSAYRRRGSQSIPCSSREPRMHKVSFSFHTLRNPAIQMMQLNVLDLVT